MKGYSLETKSRIFKATLELVAELGFHGASVARIADKADVNVGSMYYYFANKDDVLHTLYLDCKTRIAQYAFHDCSESIPADECVKRMVRNIVRYFTGHSAELSFLEQFDNSPYLANIAPTDEYAAVMKPYGDLYERLSKRGLIKDLPTCIFQSLLLGATTALTKYFLSCKDSSDESGLSAAIDAIWDMVRR